MKYKSFWGFGDSEGTPKLRFRGYLNFTERMIHCLIKGLCTDALN